MEKTADGYIVEFAKKCGTRKFCGRSGPGAKADAIVAEPGKNGDDTIYLANRGAITGNTRNGWLAIPADPVVISDMIEALHSCMKET